MTQIEQARSVGIVTGDDLLAIRPLDDRPGLRLCGEVDLSNHDVLAGVLAALEEAPADVHLDVRDLRFIDAAGMSILVTFAAGLTSGRRLVVVGASPSFRRLLAFVCPATAAVEVRG